MFVEYSTIMRSKASPWFEGIIFTDHGQAPFAVGVSWILFKHHFQEFHAMNKLLLQFKFSVMPWLKVLRQEVFFSQDSSPGVEVQDSRKNLRKLKESLHRIVLLHSKLQSERRAVARLDYEALNENKVRCYKGFDDSYVCSWMMKLNSESFHQTKSWWRTNSIAWVMDSPKSAFRVCSQTKQVNDWIFSVIQSNT